MESSRERRSGPGQRQAQAEPEHGLRGFLHDLGHELTTMSYLVESVRGDTALTEDSALRLELLAAEMSRVLDMIDHALYRLYPGLLRDEHRTVEIRRMAREVSKLTSVAHGAKVVLTPGPKIRVEGSPALLWRVLTNVVDNAGRAAGQGGHVRISLSQPEETVIEVTDDGPGLTEERRGPASLGLTIVHSLLASCDGTMDMDSPPSGGTRARIVLPGRMAAHLAQPGARRGA